MTRDEFVKRFGDEPEHDDLERASCALAGTAGHRCCGVCEHGRPAWRCECVAKRFQGTQAPTI